MPAAPPSPAIIDPGGEGREETARHTAERSRTMLRLNLAIQIRREQMGGAGTGGYRTGGKDPAEGGKDPRGGGEARPGVGGGGREQRGGGKDCDLTSAFLIFKNCCYKGTASIICGSRGTTGHGMVARRGGAGQGGAPSLSRHISADQIRIPASS